MQNSTQIEPSQRVEEASDHGTRLSFRELFFLALILFFGFCGFTVCVDKIYNRSQVNQIDNSMEEEAIYGLGLNEHSYQEDYSIEN